MELTIALCISPDYQEEDLIETLYSIPNEEGIDLVVYSDDTKKIRKIIKEDKDLERQLTDLGLLFCEEPYSSDDTYMNIAVEDCKTDLITFIKPGDTITYFDTDLLFLDDLKVGFGGVDAGYDGNKTESIASICYESRMLPLGYKGIIYSVDYLRKNDLYLGDTFIPKLIDTLLEDLEKPEYSESWGKYSIDELFTVFPKCLSPLKTEIDLPKTYATLWEKHEVSYNYYLRDLLWTRMSRAAGLLITTYPEKQSVVSGMYKYLLPENKINILC